MSYHDDPYYKCNMCGEIRVWDSSWDAVNHGWSNPSYDTHYCPDCTIEREKEHEKWLQYRKDIDSGKIKPYEPKLGKIPKWCPRIRGSSLKCRECPRGVPNCTYPDKEAKQ